MLHSATDLAQRLETLNNAAEAYPDTWGKKWAVTEPSQMASAIILSPRKRARLHFLMGKRTDYVSIVKVLNPPNDEFERKHPGFEAWYAENERQRA